MSAAIEISWADEAPRARVAAFLKHLSVIKDTREPWRVMYPLREVLLLVVCATVASCDDFDDIVAWGRHNLALLRRFSPFHHGIPGERWLCILINRIDPELFRQCFESWVAATWPDRPSLIAIDGKTSRRTHDRRKDLKALHTLSAYATTARLVLAQRSVPEKTNEITAIPDLLDDLAQRDQLKGALVTIDAMGCQVEIAERIVEHGADYLLALKGNQPNLEAEVADYFASAPEEELQTKTTIEKGHGRIERASTPPPARSIGSSRRAPIRDSRASPTSGPSCASRRRPSRPARPRPPRATSSLRPRSTSSASPAAYAAIGAWRACTGSSTAPSRTTSRATAAATAPRTWPSSDASPSASSEPTTKREASRHAASKPDGTPNSSSKSFDSDEH